MTNKNFTFQPPYPKNFGYRSKRKRPTDWKFGGETQISDEILVPNGQWDLWRPVPEYQRKPWGDTFGCVSRGILNLAEYLYAFKYGEVVNFDDRFTEKMSGTQTWGNYIETVVDSVRHDGLVKEGIWMRDDINSWDEYYEEIPQSIKDIGLAWIEKNKINDEWVTPFPEQIMEAMKRAPVGVVVSAWEKPKIIDGMEIYQRTDKQPNHFGVIDSYEENKWWIFFDNYDKTIKYLAWDFFFAFAKRIDVNKIIEPIKIQDFMKWIKLETSAAVYAANPIAAIKVPINSWDDYLAITGDENGDLIETVSPEEFKKYAEQEGKVYAFRR